MLCWKIELYFVGEAGGVLNLPAHRLKTQGHLSATTPSSYKTANSTCEEYLGGC